MAMSVVEQNRGQYHVLVIIADGQVYNFDTWLITTVVDVMQNLQFWMILIWNILKFDKSCDPELRGTLISFVSLFFLDAPAVSSLFSHLSKSFVEILDLMLSFSGLDVVS